MKIITREQIEALIDTPGLMEEIEKGLVLYSEGRVKNFPIGFLNFESPPGEVHIKSAAIEGESLYIIKIASGFYCNREMGLSSSNGVMLLFSQRTGALQALLFDEGRLTDRRTALAGAICARYLAPKNIQCIGIIGTGVQAKEQLLSLRFVTSCRKVVVWGRDSNRLKMFVNDPLLSEFSITPVQKINELTAVCQLIVTTTPSSSPLLFGADLQPGTHVTAIGADSKGKQELDVSVFQVADFIAVDSKVQCLEFGDLAHATNIIGLKPIVEIGSIIKQGFDRQEQWITIADLTWLAVEDLQIAKAIYKDAAGVSRHRAQEIRTFWLGSD